MEIVFDKTKKLIVVLFAMILIVNLTLPIYAKGGVSSNKSNNSKVINVSKSSKIKLNKTVAIVKKDHRKQLKVSVSSKYKNKEIIWKSSNENVAIVSTTGYVHALKPGKTTITATIKNVGTAKCKIIVYKTKTQKVVAFAEKLEGKNGYEMCPKIGLDDQWCAAFVRYCFEKCDVNIPGYSDPNDFPVWVPSIVSNAKKNGVWKNRGYKPKTGDIILLERRDKRW